MNFKVYFPEDILDFGKNKGLSLKVIYKYQPSYIEWAISNIKEFKIDIASFEKLPNPTPISYDKELFSGNRNTKSFGEMSENKFFELLSKADTINYMKEINANTIRNLIENDGFQPKKIDYSFPPNIVELNDSK